MKTHCNNIPVIVTIHTNKMLPMCQRGQTTRMMMWKLREDKSLVQGHLAHKCLSQDLHLGHLAPE